MCDNSLKEFSDLTNQTLTNIEADSDSMVFTLNTGERYMLYHDQDCCESVSIEDICGDLDDLIGTPILLAEEISNVDEPCIEGRDESYTWTFYKLATIKGSVTIRWYGESNGFYSESVDWKKLD